MRHAPETVDVAVIGGGPGGAIAALCCRNAGRSVVLLDKANHPRFHIGESMLPACYDLLEELGLRDRIEQLDHVPKFGAAFVTGDSAEPTRYWFAHPRADKRRKTINIERAAFDHALLQAAQDAGADIRQGVSVDRIDRLALNDVAIQTSEGPVHARVLIDASGQSAVVGRHLRQRQPLADLARVAYYQHFTGVRLAEGHARGSPVIVMCNEGWFWIIPLDDQRTSVGMVCNPDVASRAGVRANELLRWGIQRAAFMRDAMAQAQGPATNHVCADYSYTCKPFAGDGYFLIGDAAKFVDPVFSTGVCLAMKSGQLAAAAADRTLDNPAAANREADRYAEQLRRSSAPLFNLVRKFYCPAFRDFLINGQSPFRIHQALLRILAGEVFPRVRPSVRLRLVLFEFFLRVHRATGRLVPRASRTSLLDGDTLPAAAPSAT